MHQGVRRLRPPGLLALSIVALAVSASAADLVLEPVMISDQDLLRVVPREDGMIAVLQMGSVEVVSPAGARVRDFAAGEGERFYLADDGARIGVLRHRAGAADFAPAERFELRDAAGMPLWSIGPTEDVSFAISARGTVVGLGLNVNVPQRNQLRIYGPEGARVAEIAIPGLLGGEFDAEGNVFFALSSSAGLLAIDVAGQELWRLPGVRLFAPAPGGEVVAAVGEGWLKLVRAGEVAATADLGDLLVRRVAIAPDGRRVAIAGRSTLRAYDNALGLSWQVDLGDAALGFTALDLAGGDGWLLAGVARDLGPGVPVEQRHPDGEIRAYDARGAWQHTARLDFSVWNIWTPTVALDSSGRSATIITRRAVLRTVLP